MTNIIRLREDCIIVEVPEGTGGIDLYGNVLADELRYNTMPHPGRFNQFRVAIPSADWSIIASNSKQITEEQAKGLVREYIDVHENGHTHDVYFKDYEDVQQIIEDSFSKLTALESFRSLIKSKNGDPDKRYVVLTKAKS